MRELLKPYPFQEGIIEKASPLRHYAFLMDMGTGKTLTSINWLKNKWRQHGGFIDTLVICPIIVLDNWKQEFIMSTQLDPLMIGVCSNPDVKKRLKVIEDPRHRIIVINYEALLNQQIRDALIRRGFGCCLADEAHKLKNHNGKIFKSAYAITASCQHRGILTGTPIANSILDIWAQFFFMDSGETFGDSFQVFRGHYMEDENRDWAQAETAAKVPKHLRKAFPKWVVRQYKMREFQEKLEKVSSRVTTEEAVDLPEYVSQVVNLKLSKEQQEHYDQVRTQLITWLKEQPNNPLVVKTALTKILRLNEICSGYMKLEDGSIHRFKENPKLDAVEELLEASIGHKTVIFCIYSEDYDVLRERLDKLGRKYVEITGEVGTLEKLAAAKKFQDLTEYEEDVAICNTRAAGLGINLVGAKYKYYFSRDFNYVDYIQSIKRNLRAGAIKYHKTLFDYQLVYENTTDAKIFGRLIEKMKFAQEILDSKISLPELLTMQNEQLTKDDLIDVLS